MSHRTSMSCQYTSLLGRKTIFPYSHSSTNSSSYVDPAPNSQLVISLQRYYEANNVSTKVLPASLTTAAECMYLAGAQHITIAPALLQALATTPAPSTEEINANYPSLFRQTPPTQASDSRELMNYLGNETIYRLAITRRDAGKQEKKLIDAINIFSDMQEKLEALMQKILERENLLEAASSRITTN